MSARAQGCSPRRRLRAAPAPRPALLVTGAAVADAPALGSRAGAQRVDAREALDEAPGRRRLAERPGVVRAVVAQVGRRVEPRVLLGAELHVLVARHPRAVRVVVRAVTGDEALLEQEGAELRPRLDDLDALEQLERLTGVVGLALEEVVAGAPPQVLGLADVEGVAVRVAHDVDAGRGRQPVGERDLVVVAPRPGLAEAGHLFEGRHALLLEPREKEDEELGGGLGVLQGAVLGLDLGVEAVGEGRERAALLRAELARQAQRVERRALEGAARAACRARSRGSRGRSARCGRRGRCRR